MSAPTFTLWKGSGLIRARRLAPKVFSKPKYIYQPLDSTRIFGLDTESLTSDGELLTLLTSIRWWNKTEVLESLEGRGMLESLLVKISERYGVPEKGSAKPSYTAQRSKEQRQSRKGKKRSGRDGRRAKIDPCLAVLFNAPYDFGRLADDRPSLLRSVAAGADSFYHKISERFDLEVASMILGDSSSSFEWYIRDHKNGTITRLLGIDLRGYWKTSLAEASKAVGGKTKIDIESLIERVYEKPFEEFTSEEWRKFKEYAGVDAETTLDLYHATVELLRQIDLRVIRRTGVIPQSAPGAAAKIVFSKAFDCHPEITEWPRYPAWHDQLGCDAYFGGRCFSIKPGKYKNLVALDLKSAYPFQLALLPDPVTVRTIHVPPTDTFDVEDWIGKYGVLVIDGEGLDDLYPAFRVHDKETGRLQYVAGKFEKCAVTLPEIVIGVVSGALRVDKIHTGCWMKGSAEKSFLRAGMRDFFAIKEDQRRDKAVRSMAKLLANSTYGKLIEANGNDRFFTDDLLTPSFRRREQVSGSIAKLFADDYLPPDRELYWGTEERKTKAVVEFHRVLKALPGRIDPRLAKVDRVNAYIRALEVSGEPTSGVHHEKVSRYVRTNQRWRCGQYFMPLYAAQVTGATSAMLGLMARCLNALQGDTDSVHVERVTRKGLDRYFETMRRAGYPSPRLVRGKWKGGIDVPGLESLGSWTEETPVPSEESILVRPKVYSHRFPDGSFKQAKHGFPKFHSDEIEAALRDNSVPREERSKRAWKLREQALHAAMGALLGGKTVEYMTRKSPRKLTEAVRFEKKIGEFVSRLTRLNLIPDPNTFTDSVGFVRWRPLGSTGPPCPKETGPPSVEAEAAE